MGTQLMRNIMIRASSKGDSTIDRGDSSAFACKQV